MMQVKGNTQPQNKHFTASKQTQEMNTHSSMRAVTTLLALIKDNLYTMTPTFIFPY